MRERSLLLKICGNRTLDGAQAAIDHGADLLGFICYPPARRYLPPDAAAALIRQLRGRSAVRLVGVFVNQEPAHVNAVAELCGLDLVQLCGDESAEMVAAMSRPVIKVYRPQPGNGRLTFDIPGLFAAHLEAPGTGWGGSGHLADWSLARAVTEQPDRPPVILAGGLHAGNVGQAIEAVQPDGVDVSSGVETNGQPDPERIAAFLSAAKGQHA